MGHQTSAAIRRRKTARAARDLFTLRYASVAPGQDCVVELASGCVYGHCEAAEEHHATARVAGVSMRLHRSVVQHPVSSFARRCERRDAPGEGEGNQQGGRKASGKGARHGEG